MFDTLVNNVTSASVKDVIDILLVAYLFYRLMRFLRNTNAQKVFQGVVILIGTLLLADLLQLSLIYWILTNVMQVGILALVIIFQPELRKMLEQFGSQKLGDLLNLNRTQQAKSTDAAILQTIEAVNSLAWTKTGALIIFQREDSLQNIINTGTTINADVNAELLKNLFYNKAPLHDGAVIIADGRIAAAGCILPLSGKQNISKELGTNVWIKRDDLCGVALGGNKVRKLEYLLCDAKNQGYDLVMTTGQAQSNHAMLTAACAPRLGMDCVLILKKRGVTARKGNQILNHLMGVEVRYTPIRNKGHYQLYES